MREAKTMLVITYEMNDAKKEKTYASANDFVAAQLKEVPDLPDYYHVVEATVDGKEISLEDKTISGLFNYLNK
ncbi:hypothetical protein RV02_GL000207 [Enterococcus gilvus]|jgi:hypothetical protein|nr:hypothetical protein RV02_GL000207 [Enterococcus gilvus]